MERPLEIRDPVNRKQAIRVNPVQAMRVRLAIRWGIAPDDVGLWRAELELKRRNARLKALAIHPSEQVVIWGGDEVDDLLGPNV